MPIMSHTFGEAEANDVFDLLHVLLTVALLMTQRQLHIPPQKRVYPNPHIAERERAVDWTDRDYSVYSPPCTYMYTFCAERAARAGVSGTAGQRID